MGEERFEPVDARGVEVTPGATVVYGAPVGRSIAMVEAVVDTGRPFTASGRVRLNVVRRGFGSGWPGGNDTVAVRPDRLVVVLALPEATTATEAEIRAAYRRRVDEIRARTGADALIDQILSEG